MSEALIFSKVVIVIGPDTFDAFVFGFAAEVLAFHILSACGRFGGSETRIQFLIPQVLGCIFTATQYIKTARFFIGFGMHLLVAMKDHF